MTIGSAIAAHLPFLRRYARALTGDQGTGDGLVREMLEAAVDDAPLRTQLAAGRVALYTAFTHRWAAGRPAPSPGGQAWREASAQASLGNTGAPERQALLLTALEGFDPAQTGAIMGISAKVVEGLVVKALADIRKATATCVLIVEDEPLIAMQLEEIVRAQGHTVCGTAATRTQAQALAKSCPPGLVLADIQLADGSSGLDAADDVLAATRIPVIFITAFPERLLTGSQPEPTWLVTKPFREEAVHAAIAQALFFAPVSAPA